MRAFDVHRAALLGPDDVITVMLAGVSRMPGVPCLPTPVTEMEVTTPVLAPSSRR